MAEEEQDSKVNRPVAGLPKNPLPFVEVICKGSGKTRRFASGTEAGFAVSLINKKLDGGPLGLYIEAVKEGEEPVSFSPNSVLVDYGPGWKLQTVTESEGLRKREFNRPTASARPPSTFVEVICKGSGKTRRFSSGTEAGFAVSLINKKLDGGPLGLYIEAVKEGEEPVSFGPNSVLVDYGPGWKLQTVTESKGFRWLKSYEGEGVTRLRTSH